MLTLACPFPDGNIPITKRDKRDDLREILVQLGFEFLVEKNLEEIRTELDSEGKGIVHIDKFSEWIVKKLDIYLNEQALVEAFELFDADKDGKINMEEFEFFMNGFAKDMNILRGNKMVKDLLAESQKYAGEDKLFEITKLVQVLRDAWK
jgi:Ca2+-binding EF-hand superfamily protein